MFLQKLKITLFREKFIINNIKKAFSRNIKIKNFIFAKIAFFKTFQFLLVKFLYFVHYNLKKKLYIDFNFNKKFDLTNIIYYIKKFVN